MRLCCDNTHCCIILSMRMRILTGQKNNSWTDGQFTTIIDNYIFVCYIGFRGVYSER